MLRFIENNALLFMAGIAIVLIVNGMVALANAEKAKKQEAADEFSRCVALSLSNGLDPVYCLETEQ